MSYIIDYAVVSPSVLTMVIEQACMNALPICHDIDEDYFEIYISGWLPLTQSDMVAIERALAPFV